MKRYSDLVSRDSTINNSTITRVLTGLLLLFCSSSLGCKPKADADSSCERVCSAANQCLSDSCGGMCGCVDDDKVCNADNICVARNTCSGSCDGRECGTVCDQVCGDNEGLCGEGEECVEGLCVCVPECDNIHCGQDDGCGGLCGCDDGKVCDEASRSCIESAGACEERECGTWDGENCGTCPDNLLCNADGRCVNDCDDLCSDVGWECDESICHDECGSCKENEECVNHICVCRPNCEEGSCDDGCGGACDCEVGEKCDDKTGKCVPCTAEDTCGDMECGEVCGYPCGANDGACTDGDRCVDGFCLPSTLKMGLISAEFSKDDGKVHGTLQIDYAPKEGEPKPRMADIRIRADRDVSFELTSVTLGGAGTSAKKSLYLDPISLLPWRYHPDGSVQLLVHTDKEDLASANKPFEEGVLLLIDFSVTLESDNPDSAVEENLVELSLVRRDQTFAPFDADIALQETAYEQAVVVTK